MDPLNVTSPPLTVPREKTEKKFKASETNPVLRIAYKALEAISSFFKSLYSHIVNIYHSIFCCRSVIQVDLDSDDSLEDLLIPSFGVEPPKDEPVFGAEAAPEEDSPAKLSLSSARKVEDLFSATTIGTPIFRPVNEPKDPSLPAIVEPNDVVKTSSSEELDDTSSAQEDTPEKSDEESLGVPPVIESSWMELSTLEPSPAPTATAGLMTYFKAGALGVINNMPTVITNLVGNADEGFTTKAPDYKQKQISYTIAHLKDEIVRAFAPHKQDANCPWDIITAGIVEEIEQARRPVNAIKNLLALPLDAGNTLGYRLDAPLQRHQFLMQLEDVLIKADYEKHIDAYLRASPEERQNYPDIKFLHTLATALMEAPIWSQATDELKRHLDYSHDFSAQDPLTEVLKKDVKQMKAQEKNPKAGMDVGCVKLEKARMQSGEKGATTYRYNYTSLLGELDNHDKKAKWLRLGAPTMDGGDIDRPAKLTALYTLYLDACTAEGKKLAFYGLQKSPAVENIVPDGEGGVKLENYDRDDYEKNRTAAFILASKNPRWKETFSFINLSFDEVFDDLELNIKKENIDSVSLSKFSDRLEKLMSKNVSGFYGLNPRVVRETIRTVIQAFFFDDPNLMLSYDDRVAFLMLTYAVVALKTNTALEIDAFHINCKDGIDRAGVLNALVLLVSQFNKPLDKQSIDELRTMFHHGAWFVKGQAVIPERASLLYKTLDKILSVRTSADYSMRCIDLDIGCDFAPFVEKGAKASFTKRIEG